MQYPLPFKKKKSKRLVFSFFCIWFFIPSMSNCTEIPFHEAVQKTLALIEENTKWCDSLRPKYNEVECMVIHNFLFWMQNTHDGVVFDARPEYAVKARERDARLLQQDCERDPKGILYNEAERVSRFMSSSRKSKILCPKCTMVHWNLRCRTSSTR